MNTEALAAWWGAIIATIVACWECYKWFRSGPKIIVVVKSNMRATGDTDLEGKRLLITEVANVGDKPATVCSLWLTYYSSWWRKLLNRPSSHFICKNPGRDDPLPKKLDVGDTWTGFSHEEGDLVAMASSGYLYVRMPVTGYRDVYKRVPAAKK